MNSLLSHKTRRYGRWTLLRFVNEVGTSQFICLLGAQRRRVHAANGGDPRQDDYDIWLGTGIIKPWIACDRHTGRRQLPLPRRPRRDADLGRGRARHVPRQAWCSPQDGSYPY